ncbi:MAG: type III pantothenate kinase, partial [Methylococcaceae bacterium]
TVAAIHSGAVYAAAGLIEKVLSRQTQTFTLFLTGGDATFIAAELAVEATIYDDLVLRGLLAVITAC